jgi:hypothetical protein
VTSSRLLEALRALLPALLPREPYLGPRRYRVVRMRPSASSSEQTRVELQIVTAATGMPDVLMVPVWPGVAGAHAELAPGAHVLVEFIDGDPEQPFVAAFSTRDDPAWRPAYLTLDAAATVRVGPSAATVELAGKASDTIAVPGAEAGRVVRYGDVIMFPAGPAATPTALPVLGSAPGAIGAPVPPIVASRVRA